MIIYQQVTPYGRTNLDYIYRFFIQPELAKFMKFRMEGFSNYYQNITRPKVQENGSLLHNFSKLILDIIIKNCVNEKANFDVQLLVSRKAKKAFIQVLNAGHNDETIGFLISWNQPTGEDLDVSIEVVDFTVVKADFDRNTHLIIRSGLFYLVNQDFEPVFETGFNEINHGIDDYRPYHFVSNDKVGYAIVCTESKKIQEIQGRIIRQCRKLPSRVFVNTNQGSLRFHDWKGKTLQFGTTELILRCPNFIDADIIRLDKNYAIGKVRSKDLESNFVANSNGLFDIGYWEDDDLLAMEIDFANFDGHLTI